MSPELPSWPASSLGRSSTPTDRHGGDRAAEPIERSSHVKPLHIRLVAAGRSPLRRIVPPTVADRSMPSTIPVRYRCASSKVDEAAPGARMQSGGRVPVSSTLPTAGPRPRPRGVGADDDRAEHQERPERQQQRQHLLERVQRTHVQRDSIAPISGPSQGVSAHVGVAVVRRRHERLLDRARRGPAQQVDRGAGLVVGAAGPAAAERLLADDRAGRLVVDVEVAGREPQLLLRPGDRAPVPGDDRAGQRVRRDALDLARRPSRSRRRRRRARPGSGRSTRW